MLTGARLAQRPVRHSRRPAAESKSLLTSFAPLWRSMGRRVEVVRAPSELSDRVSKIEAKLALLQSDPTACDSHETWDLRALGPGQGS